MRYMLLTFGCLLLLSGVGMAQDLDDQPPLMASLFDHPCPMSEPGMKLFQRPEGGMGGPGGPGRGGHGDWRGKRRHLEQLRMLKLLEFLDLNEDQEVAFLTGFKRMREEEQQLDSLRRVEVEKLATLVTDESASDASIDMQVKKVIDLQEQRMAAIKSSLQELGAELTPRQRAKLLIFRDRFEYEILKRVNEFQRRQGRDLDDLGGDQDDN